MKLFESAILVLCSPKNLERLCVGFHMGIFQLGVMIFASRRLYFASDLLKKECYAAEWEIRE